MPRSTKSLERLQALPADMRYSELVPLLESLGWRIGESGSHVVVTSPRGFNITLARTPERMKRTYLRMILNELGQCGQIEE